MMLTTKSVYAIMAIIDIAKNQHNGYVNVADVSERQKISVSYLEQIFSKLRKADIVKSFKGPGGGYLIQKPLSDIKIVNIIDSVKENLKMTRCSQCTKNNCIPEGELKCETHYLWKGLTEVIRGYFSSISVQDVVNNSKMPFDIKLVIDTKK